MLARVCVQRARHLSKLARGYQSTIDPMSVEVHKTTNPKSKVALDDLVFGHTFSDHMLEVDWDIENGWHNPVIKPHGPLQLDPAAPCLHYGIECFEGMKAYKDAEGNVRMFRPDKNMERLNNSMARVAMPRFNGNGFIECMKHLLRIDESWVPQSDRDGFSLYLRPTAIGTNANLGVTSPTQAKLYCITSPSGPYYKSGFGPIKLLADTENVRAWPGGVGNSKLGGNYGPTLVPQAKAAKELDCQQILWLFGPDHHTTEVGAMNIFFIIKNKTSGKPELITAPLDRGDILPGITRISILELARNGRAGDIDVSERDLPMAEVVEAAKDGRLMESFGAGTAAIISPVNCISYKGEDINVPTGDGIGPIAKQFWTILTDIQYGKVEHEWSVVV